jgi:Flp pilus assembly protein TadD
MVPSRWVPVVYGLSLIAVGLAIYAGSFGGPFIYDDIPSILDNPAIQRLWPPHYLVSAPSQSTLVSRPLVGATLALNHALSGDAVGSYHVVNLAIHLSCALLLMGLVRRTLLLPTIPADVREASGGLAWAAAMLWVAHPLQTEAVVYVIQRTETMMAFFFLLTLYAAVRGWTVGDPEQARLWQALGVLACAAGMLSKEVMVAAPIVVLLYDRTFVSRSFAASWRDHRRLYLSLALTWVVLLLVVLTGDRSASTGTGLGITPWRYLLTQAGVLVWYLRLSLWPHPLAVSYEDWPFADGLTDVLGPGLLVAGLLGVTVWALYRRPALGFLGAVFFLVLAPTSSIWPIATEPAAERRLYLPLAALVVLLLLGLYRGMRPLGRTGRIGLVALVMAVVFVSGVAAARRVEDYRTAVGIWESCVQVRPRNAAAHNNLGQALVRDGRAEPAILHFEEAIRLDPASTEAHSNLGGVLAEAGRRTEAIELLERALQLNPNRPVDLHNNLGVLLARAGRIAEARLQFESAIELGAPSLDAHLNLGQLLAWQEDWSGAIEQFEAVLAIDAARGDVAVSLGDALCRSGQTARADHLEQRFRSRGAVAVADEIAARCHLDRKD